MLHMNLYNLGIRYFMSHEAESYGACMSNAATALSIMPRSSGIRNFLLIYYWICIIQKFLH